MKASRSLSLSLFTLLLLAGLALWYFQSKPVAPQAAPLAQTKPVAPVTSPQDTTAVAQGGVGQPASAPAPVAASSPVQQLVSSTPARQPAIPEPSPATAATPSTLTFPHHSAESSSAEIAATARMYAAHAPLRTPEVSDPDSKANKQILGTMVAKALAQPATPPPSRASASAK